MGDQAGPNSEPRVAMQDVVRFVRQLSHDLRNHLNAAELQAAFVGELAQDAESKTEIKRLRGVLSEAAVALQKLSSTIADVKLTAMEYGAADFVEDLRLKLAQQLPDKSGDVHWNVKVDGSAALNIDPQALQQAMVELFDNAFRHARASGPVSADVHGYDGEFVFTLREPKPEFKRTTDLWGHEPFQSVSHGHYGLGLHRVRRIIDGHNGQFDARYDPTSASLVTTVRLPLAGRTG
ncbi:MAG: sensor histidine kinase [Chthoniobacterales bacterium]